VLHPADMTARLESAASSNAPPESRRADAKAAGVKFGRKSTLTPHQQREAMIRWRYSVPFFTSFSFPLLSPVR
jgi:hypothetical protein